MPDAVTSREIPLLERGRELDVLSGALRAAAAGEGRLVVVRGGPGTGKSRLIDEAAAAAEDVEVLRAAGRELERDLPFGVVLQLLERRVAGAPGAEREELLSGAGAPARALLDGAEAPASPGRGVESRLLHALSWVVASLADQQPVALLIDDAHWADEPSLRFVAYLAARIADLPATIVVTLRPQEPGVPAALLERMAAEASATVEPRPLGPDAAAQLTGAMLRADPAPEFAAACHEAAGGNPLLLVELLAALAAEGVAPEAAAAGRVGAVGPEAVARSVFLTLERLGDDAIALARAVAVLGDAAEPADAAALAGLSLPDAAQVADDLAGAGLLRREAVLGFAQPVLRAAILDRIPPVDRALAHREAARVIGSSGAAPERAAAHLLRARPGGDPAAVELLRRAADAAAARGAYGTAADLLGRALAEPPEPELRGELTLALAGAEAADGRPGAAARYEEAIGELPPGGRRAAALLELGRLHASAGRTRDAADAFERGLAEPTSGEDLEADLRAGLAGLALWDPALRDAREPLRALVEGDARPATPAERILLAQASAAAFMAVEPHDVVQRSARAAWDDGAFLAAAAADPTALSSVTGGLTCTGATAESREVASAAIAYAQREGLPAVFAHASYLRASAWHYSGDLAETVADAEQALAAPAAGWEFHRSSAVGLLAIAYAERGEPGRAEALLAAEPVEAAAGGFPIDAPIWHARGLVALEQGRPKEAADALLHTGHLLRDVLGTANPTLLPWAAGAVLALRDLGQSADARRLAEEDVAAARRFGAPHPLATALWARAGLEPAREAIPLLEEARAVLEGVEALLVRARVLNALGVALRAAGEREAARPVLREALELAHAAGAVSLATRAREELQAAGGRPRRERITGRDALTPSERRVVELAAAGRTNRQIAQDLFVTVAAVRYHLRNAYAKLGVEEREGLAEALDGSSG